MTKYSALQAHLESLPSTEVPMSFAEIERVIGAKLPSSQRYPAWWSNNPSNNPMTKAWLAAGYRTERVDMAGRRLVFKRTDDRRTPIFSEPSGSVSRRSAAAAPLGAEGKRHPLFGALAGLAKTAPGVDLTHPAEPTWGERS